MSGRRGKSGRDASQGIDLRLGDLFGELGSALSGLIERLDEGGSGEIRRDHRIETDRGPIRAQAGIRIRMGGLEARASEGDPARPRETPPSSAPVTAPAPRPVEADVVTDGGLWRLTADLPGATMETLDVQVNDGQLLVSATARGRRYADRFDLPPGITRGDLRVSLENGILEIEAEAGGATGA